MKHKNINDKLILYLYDELSPGEKQEIAEHIKLCSNCSDTLAEYKSMITLLDNAIDNEINEAQLNQARAELNSAIRNSRRKKNYLSEIIDLILVPSRKSITLAYSLSLILILFILINSFNKPDSINVAPSTSVGQSEAEDFTNVRFHSTDFRNGLIEISYDKITPVRYKGNLNNPEIQQLLAHSLLNSENPGTRLKAVSAVIPSNSDNIIKNALLLAARNDANPGVRKEALKTISKYPMDNDIKNNLIYILQNDKEPGIRIMAINLIDKKTDEMTINEQFINLLKEKMNDDQNSYIKLKAKSILNKINS